MSNPTNTGQLESGRYNNRLYWLFKWSSEPVDDEPGLTKVTWSLTAKGRATAGETATWYATSVNSKLVITPLGGDEISIYLAKLYPHDLSHGGTDPLICYDGHQHVPSDYLYTENGEKHTISNVFYCQHNEDGTGQFGVAFEGLNKIYSTKSKGGYNSSQTFELPSNAPYGEPSSPDDLWASVNETLAGTSVQITWEGGDAGYNDTFKEYCIQYKVGTGEWNELTTASTNTCEFIPEPSHRGKSISFRVQTITERGLASEWKAKANLLEIRNLPMTPEVQIDREIVPSDGGMVKFTLSPAFSDQHLFAEVEFCYSTTNNYAEALQTDRNLEVMVTEGTTYYFWTYWQGTDQYCATPCELKVDVNERPAITYADVEYNNNKFSYSYTSNKQIGDGLSLWCIFDRTWRVPLPFEVSGKQASGSIEPLSFFYQSIQPPEPLLCNELYEVKFYAQFSDGIESTEQVMTEAKFETPTVHLYHDRGEDEGGCTCFANRVTVKITPYSSTTMDTIEILGIQGELAEVDGDTKTYAFDASTVAPGAVIKEVYFNRHQEGFFALSTNNTLTKRFEFHPRIAAVNKTYDPYIGTLSIRLVGPEHLARESALFPTEDEKPLPIILESPNGKTITLQPDEGQKPYSAFYDYQLRFDKGFDLFCYEEGKTWPNGTSLEYKVHFTNLLGETTSATFNLTMAYGLASWSLCNHVFWGETEEHSQTLSENFKNKIDAYYQDVFDRTSDPFLDDDDSLPGYWSAEYWDFIKEGITPWGVVCISTRYGQSEPKNIKGISIIDGVTTITESEGITKIGECDHQYNYDGSLLAPWTWYHEVCYLVTYPKIGQIQKDCEIKFGIQCEVDDRTFLFDLLKPALPIDDINEFTGKRAVGHREPKFEFDPATLDFDQESDSLEIEAKLIGLGVDKENLESGDFFMSIDGFSAKPENISVSGFEFAQKGVTNIYTMSGTFSKKGSSPASLVGVELFHVAPKCTSTLRVKHNKSGQHYYETQYSNESRGYLPIYNDVPSIAYRPNCIGINTYFENFDQYNAASSDKLKNNEGQAVLMICPTDLDNNAATGSKKLIVLRGIRNSEEYDAVINVETGQIDGFIVDGGTW